MICFLDQYEYISKTFSLGYMYQYDVPLCPSSTHARNVCIEYYYRNFVCRACQRRYDPHDLPNG